VSMVRNVLLLCVATLAGTLLLNQADEITLEQRERNAALHESRMLSQVLPEMNYDEPPGLARIAISYSQDPLHDKSQKADDTKMSAFPVYVDGQLMAVAIAITETDGYVGPISLLVGIDANGNVTGVRATTHRETPGLGDQIDAGKSDWINSFDGYSLRKLTAERWELQRDGGHFDHISGATITSRAVVRSVRQALQSHADWQAETLNRKP